MGIKFVAEAADGQEGLKVLTGLTARRESSSGENKEATSHKMVDLIICDWAMPRMTGLEMLSRVRTLADYKHLPFVMLTAESSSAQVTDAIKLGVTDYIVKPFTPSVLDSKIRTILNLEKKT